MTTPTPPTPTTPTNPTNPTNSAGSDTPVVDDVRARAMAISARYGHDLRRYARHLAEVQAAQRARVVDQPRVSKSGDQDGGRQSKPAA